MFGFALKHGWLVKSPFQRSLEFSIPQQSPTYVAKEDFQTLLGKVKEPVLRHLLLFAALSGLRLPEILNLKWSAVDFEKRQFTVSNSETFITKTGKERTVPMHEEVYKVLSLRRGNGTEDGLVFCKRGGFRLERKKERHGYLPSIELEETSDPSLRVESCILIATWVPVTAIAVESVADTAPCATLTTRVRTVTLLAGTTNGSVGTIDATITRFRTQDGFAVRALVKELTRTGRHRFFFAKSTMRTRHDGIQNNFTHSFPAVGIVAPGEHQRCKKVHLCHTSPGRKR